MMSDYARIVDQELLTISPDKTDFISIGTSPKSWRNLWSMTISRRIEMQMFKGNHFGAPSTEVPTVIELGAIPRSKIAEGNCSSNLKMMTACPSPKLISRMPRYSTSTLVNFRSAMRRTRSAPKAGTHNRKG
jgi:hypothetical protein